MELLLSVTTKVLVLPSFLDNKYVLPSSKRFGRDCNGNMILHMYDVMM